MSPNSLWALLSAAFGLFFVTFHSQPPNQYPAGKKFDDAVQSEGQDSYASGLEASPESNHRLHQVP